MRQLRYFATVAEELHFGRAAARLHISQPPLSVQIKRLEDELGVTLLHRSTRHVELTAAGAELAARLRTALPELDASFVDLQEMQAGQRGRLTVGFVSSANYTMLPAAVRLFRERRPHVRLDLQPLTSAEQLDALLSGSIDLGIVRDAAPTDTFDFRDLLAERLVACVPSGHPIAAQSSVRPAELARLPMITFPRSLMPGYVDQIRSLLGESAHHLHITQQVIHQETALSFVAAGVGFTVLPESVTRLQPGSITAVAIAGSPQTRLSTVTVPGRDAPAAAAFLACLDETLQPETERPQEPPEAQV
nr:LysR family transcriptional regulator [Pseudoclavibacter sp. 13-3]